MGDNSNSILTNQLHSFKQIARYQLSPKHVYLAASLHQTNGKFSSEKKWNIAGPQIQVVHQVQNDIIDTYFS